MNKVPFCMNMVFTSFIPYCYHSWIISIGVPEELLNWNGLSHTVGSVLVLEK